LLSANDVNGIAADQNDNMIIIDVNNDYEIQESEALLVWSLNLQDAGISDATGLEFFTNLRVLDCANNSGLTSLDLTSLINLEEFHCDGGTPLDFLTFSGLSNLQYVYLYDTNLNTVDFTGVTSLEYLGIHYAPLTSLDFSDMINLQDLSIFYTDLVDVNLGESPLISNINFIGNSELETLSIKNGGVIPNPSNIHIDNN